MNEQFQFTEPVKKSYLSEKKPKVEDKKATAQLLINAREKLSALELQFNNTPNEGLKTAIKAQIEVIKKEVANLERI